MALILIATLVAFGAFLFAWNDSSIPLYLSLTTIVYFYLSAVFLVIVLALLLAIPINLFKWIAGATALFGQTARVRILSFGLATILFASALVPFFSNLIEFFIDLLRNAPQYLSEAWNYASAACGGGTVDFGQCISVTGFGFFNSWISAFSSAYYSRTLLDVWTVIQVMGWLVIWVLLAQIFNLIEPAATTGGRGESRLTTWLKARNKALWQNVALVLVLALGAYLSLVAIVAIPALRPDTSPVAEDITGESLAVQLQSLAESQSVEPSYDPSERLPFATLTAFLEEHSDAASFVKFTLEDITAIRTSAINQLTLLQEYRASVQVSDRARAAETFTIRQQTRLGNRENAEYYLQLVDWYMGHIDQTNDSIIDCSSALSAADWSWSRWAESMTRTLTDALDQSSDPMVSALSPLPSPPSEVVRTLNSECVEPRLADDPMPDRPILGTYWGPLGMLAVWVLESETMPLALIVGMVGFGVLGAAASTIIRERLEAVQRGVDNGEGVVVRDLFGVLVRGISSAVVVFLAAEGGLSILAVEDTEPNPYALLLLCLIAAVFSEVVWDWAQKWLGERLGAARLPDSAPIPPGDGETEVTDAPEDDAAPEDVLAAGLEGVEDLDDPLAAGDADILVDAGEVDPAGEGEADDDVAPEDVTG